MATERLRFVQVYFERGKVVVNRVLNANCLFKMLAIVFSIDQSFYQSTGLSSNQALDYFLLVFPAVAIVVIVHYRLHAIK